jgi:ABC-type multidrug transport system ATPase subunit
MNEPFDWQRFGADPALVVSVGGTQQTLSAGSPYWVGRNPRSDIVLDDSRVSWDHAVLQVEQGKWFVEDHGSTNGTFVGPRRIDRFEITGDCTLRFGHAADGPAVLCSPSRRVIPSPPASPPPWPPASASPGPPASASPGLPASASPGLPASPPPWRPSSPSPGPPPSPPVYQPAEGGSFQWSRVDVRPTKVMRVPVRTLRIGRAKDNDVVLTDLGVSRYHAELRNAGGRYEIVDLGSHNGTFLNGTQVISRAPVTEQDIVGIGMATFRLVGDELREFMDQGDVTLVAQDLTVRVAGNRVLLDRVSFPIAERSLVAIIGPSGAGKTTLLRALTGIRPADEGAVLYDNRDLYSHYAELRHRIGLVPQEDIIYPQLTPRRALSYAAELRFPGDTSSEERHHRVQEVIDELKLMQTSKERPEPAADRRAGSLSGGEKKRVNIAVELLTKPSVLFLDEPTSSLDVELKEDVMDSMRELAKDGRTVIIVTHDLEYLDKCDRVLVLMRGGKMAFYGPSADGLRYFGKTHWVEVYRAFRSEPDRDWAGEFERSSCYQQYMASGLTGQTRQSARSASKPPPAPRSRLAQLTILCRRYAALIAADRGFLISLVALPILFGAMVRVLAHASGLTGQAKGLAGPETTLLFLAIIASLTGAASSVRELLKERTIYLRERTAGLSAGAYLLSKLVVLGLIAALQAVLLVVVGVAGVRMNRGAFLASAPLAELLLGVAALTIASMALGLVVSAFVTSSEKTMQALVLVTLLQVLLSGGLVPLGEGLKQVAYLAPTRWGFAATASTINLNMLLPPGVMTDPLWDHEPSAWLIAMIMLVVLVVVYMLITWWWLIMISPGRSRPLAKLRARAPKHGAGVPELGARTPGKRSAGLAGHL